MSKKVTVTVTALAAAVVLTLAPYASAQCGGKTAHKNNANDDKAAATQAPDIVDTAVAAGSFKTLVAAVQAAGLESTLRGDGPFTVFAPTDEAFAKLPAGTVENLLKPENKDQLIAILTYHVVAGKVLAKDVVKLDGAKTVQGSTAPIEVTEGGVTVAGAKVLKTDILTKNGVIHVIDRVIIPEIF